jgi:hypothetical protein
MKGHPIVTAFDSAVGKNRRISYLPARAFSAVVLDLLAPPAATLADAIMEDPASALTPDSETALEALRVHPDTQHVDEFAGTLAADSPLRREALPRLRAAVSDGVMDRARATVEQLPRWHPARRPLLRMLADAADERELFRAKLEHWYDDAMDRLSGWYKRRVQRAILVYAAVLTLFFNVDSVNMVETLWRSPVEQVAAAQAAATAAGTDLSTIDTSLSRLEGLAVPIGWDLASSGNPDANRRGMPADRGQWFLKVLGLGLTVVALGFGAPFWFDVLGKVARVRDTGPRPARDGTPAL